MLEILNLSVNANGVDILKNISVTFNSANLTCIFGASGSGKSTFLKTLPALIDYKGLIKLDGKDTADIPPVVLRRRVLYVNQFPSSPEPTVKESILSPFTYKSNLLPIPSDEVLINTLNEFLLPEGCLMKNPAELSGGELQRVHLVKAMLLNPEWLVMDEPTSALDLRSQERFLSIIKKKLDKCGIIMVSHSPEVISACPHKVCINRGRLEGVWDGDLSVDFIRNAIGEEE